MHVADPETLRRPAAPSCSTCQGEGYVIRRGGMDACPVCAERAELRYLDTLEKRATAARAGA